MLKVEYCPEGLAINDWQGEVWLTLVHNTVKSLIYGYRDNPDTLKVSTSLPIYLLQREVVRGNLAPEAVEIIYNGQAYHINEYGAIPDWPTGLADIHAYIAQDIITGATLKRRAKCGF